MTGSGSEWIDIFCTVQTTPGGKTLQQTLIDLMVKFPSYELWSEQGIEGAIRDIEYRLSYFDAVSQKP